MQATLTSVQWILAATLGSIDPSAQDLAGIAQEFEARLKAENIELDLEKREVRVPGVFLRRQADQRFPIEYALIGEKGASHEALAVAQCTPSLLNACMLALDLKPGRGREHVLKEPLPSEEDVRSGLEDAFRLVPPTGDRVFLYVWFKDESGQEVMGPIEDFLVDGRTQELLPMRGFLYSGSRFAEGSFNGDPRRVYLADVEGNIVTFVPTQAPAENSLFQVYALDLEPYAFAELNPARLPPKNGIVQFIFTPVHREGTRPLDPDEPLPTSPLPPARVAREKTVNPYLKNASDEWVERIGVRDTSDVVRMLRRAASPLREIAAGLLGSSDSEKAVSELFDAVRLDRSEDVRLSAVFALAEIGNEQAIRKLIAALRSEHVVVREDALFGLRLFSGLDLGMDADRWDAWASERFH